MTTSDQRERARWPIAPHPSDWIAPDRAGPVDDRRPAWVWLPALGRPGDERSSERCGGRGFPAASHVKVMRRQTGIYFYPIYSINKCDLFH